MSDDFLPALHEPRGPVSRPDEVVQGEIVDERKFLYSPGFGAGWSTWIGTTREHKEFALFYQPLIRAVEANEDIGLRGSPFAESVEPGSPLGNFVADFEKAFPDEGEPYLGGARDLQVGRCSGQFLVEEYDGSEYVTERDATDWF